MPLFSVRRLYLRQELREDVEHDAWYSVEAACSDRKGFREVRCLGGRCCIEKVNTNIVGCLKVDV
jgi:hypothetical protein